MNYVKKIHQVFPETGSARKLIIIHVMLISLFLTSCMKDLLDTAPSTRLGIADMWTTAQLTQQGVDGVYNALRPDFSGTIREPYLMDALATAQDRNQLPLLNGTITPSTAIIGSVWADQYEGIRRANEALEALEGDAVVASEADRERNIAELRFLRAYFYYRLNQAFAGVPLYVQSTSPELMTLPRSTEQEVWDFILSELTLCIEETNLPDKYQAGDSNFGRITKGAAYALRGKTYLYTEQWEEAETDFAAVGTLGYALFQGEFGSLFTEANEQSDEAIFSIQFLPIQDFGSSVQLYLGFRSSFGGPPGGNWSHVTARPITVDLFENADGSAFNWNDFIPGYNEMTPALREVFFFRNNLTTAEITAAAARGLDMSLYLPNGNEERIRSAYDNRDPRLDATIVTPYASFLGFDNNEEAEYTVRWPYRTQVTPTFDLRTDEIQYLHYVPRKFIYEGGNPGIPNRAACGVDHPIIRYAEVLLLRAEALNELGRTAEAIELVNQVRARAGVGLLNTSAETMVSGTEDLQDRIRNEFRKEFLFEGLAVFNEMRWGTWNAFTFSSGGNQQVWGQTFNTYVWMGDYQNVWPIPLTERQFNPNLTQNPGWVE